MNDYKNEISVIGSLLISPETLDIISASLTTSDFESNKCKAAYRAALKLQDSGEPIDIASISEQMSKAGFKNNGGWLMECMEVTCTAANIELYCRLTKQDANRRRLLHIAEQIGEDVDNYADWQEIVSKATGQIDDLKDSANGDVISSLDMANEWFEYYQKVSENPEYAFCKTGYKSLDAKYGGGMFKQGMYIVGARPGMGKTTLGIGIAENVAKRGKNVLMISLEMSRTQIMAKRIARESGLSYTKLLAGGLTETEQTLAINTVGMLSDRPFFLTDKSNLTVADIGRCARKIKDLSLVLIDHIGFVMPEDSSSNKSRYEATTEISANIKALAKLLNVPIIVLCQLNRENTKRAASRPQLQDLRDTGAIEQDADCVTLLHREDYYADKSSPDYVPPEREKIEMIVAKNRHGETGIVEMIWQGSSGTIFELDYTHSGTDDDCPFES